MFNCLLCTKKFKTKKGLSSHLSKFHNIHDQKQKFSLYIIGDFFPLIENRSWSKAENMLQQIRQKRITNEWMMGYLHALNGMLSAFKLGDSSNEPYIFALKRTDYKKLQEVKNTFSEFSKKLVHAHDFDAAYFQAWKDFTYYVMNSKL